MTDANERYASESTALPLGDLLMNPELLRAPEVVIPHFCMEGRVTLLSGREKTGKSTIVGQAVADATKPTEIFGVPVSEPIRTLWYALDEPLNDTVRRFQKLGAAHDGIILNAKPRTVQDVIDAIQCDLEAYHSIGVAVFDNLSRMFAASGIDANVKREVEPPMNRLVDLCHEVNLSAIFLYHTGKAGREYNGSTAIGATVDEVLTLRRRGHSDEDDFEDDGSGDDGRRLLVQDGRNLRGRLQLTFQDGLYRLYEENAQPRDRIMETLRDHGSVYGRAELAKQAGVRKANALKIIAELIGSGAIIENGRQLKPSSGWFPQGGTTPEPRTEPVNRVGSAFGKVGVTEMGTAQPITRQVHRDGRLVTEVLKLTQHGDRWFPAEDEAARGWVVGRSKELPPTKI